MSSRAYAQANGASGSDWGFARGYCALDANRDGILNQVDFALTENYQSTNWHFWNIDRDGSIPNMSVLARQYVFTFSNVDNNLVTEHSVGTSVLGANWNIGSQASVVNGFLLNSASAVAAPFPTEVATLSRLDGLIANLPSGVDFDIDVDTSEGVTLARHGNYDIDFDDKCVVGSTRFQNILSYNATEGEWSPVGSTRNTVSGNTFVTLGINADKFDPTALFASQYDYTTSTLRTGHYSSFSYNVSETDMAGFNFQGDSVINLRADVAGNIVFLDTYDVNEFPETDGHPGDVTMTVHADSRIYGDLVFGNRNISEVGSNNMNPDDASDDATTRREAAHDVVLRNNGTVRNIDFRNTSNVTLVNSGTVGSEGGYGIDAQSIDVGIHITNKSGGSITNINGSDSPVITVLNENGGEINGIFLNSFDKQFDRDGTTRDPDEFDLAAGEGTLVDVRTEIQNAGSLNRLTADRNAILIFTNTSTGQMHSPTDTTIVLSGSAAVSFTNSGSITASSSDTIDLREYEGTMVLNNTSTISASTNNTIWADGSSGAYTFTNSGTIANTSNRAISVRDYQGAGTITLNNSGTISSNQTAVSFADVDPLTDRIDITEDSAVDVTVTNSGPISARFGNAIDARNVNSFTMTNSAAITSNVDAAVNLQAVETIDINNSGSVVNNAHTAIMAASSISTTLVNSGTIQAFNRNINLNNLFDDVSITNSGGILNTHASTQGDSVDLENYAIMITPVDGARSNNIDITNQTGGTIYSATGRALGIRDFTDNDEINIDNQGTISGVANSAVDLTGSDNITFNNDGTVSTEGDKAINFENASLVSFTNGVGGTVSASGDGTIDFTGLVGASAVITNYGSITSAASGALVGELSDSVNFISITNRTSGTTAAVISSKSNAESDLSAASSTGSIFLTYAAATTFPDVSIENTGNILAGIQETETVDGFRGSNAIRLEDFAGASVTVSNTGDGNIIATGQRAIYITATAADDLTTFTLNNGADATISAEDLVVVVGNQATNDDTDGTIVTVENDGDIIATSETASHLLEFTNISREFSLTNSGTIGSNGNGAIDVLFNVDATDSDNVVSLSNQTGGVISSQSNTLQLRDIEDDLNFQNLGTIAATDGNGAVSLTGIGQAGDNSDVVFNNGGTISATGTAAVTLTDFDGELDFDTQVNSVISATNDTIVLTPEANVVEMDFVNRGSIRATATTADHLLRFSQFLNAFEFDNLAGASISSNGSHALHVSNFAGTDANSDIDFDNAGTISSRTGRAVTMQDFSGDVEITNSGSILVSAGDFALVSSGGRSTDFDNSGTISVSGDNAVFFDEFQVNLNDNSRLFRNRPNGQISADSNSFVLSASGAHGSFVAEDFRFDNEGSITARAGARAVDMSGFAVDFVSSGTITATASPAVVVGGGSRINISGNVSAAGANPRAVDLEGTGSTIILADTARVLGDFHPVRKDSNNPITDPEDRHRVVLNEVSLASYYYEFDTDYFRFFIGSGESPEERIDGRGFAPATANYDAVPQMHVHHARNSREIWRQFGRFEGGTSMRTFGFADDLSADESASREYDLSGTRTGFAHSVQQSIFDFFNAELVLASSNSEYELDTNVFTFEQGYQAIGLGFGDLLSIGPFSLSAMGLTGLGETTLNRLVYTNTNDAGFYNLSTTYDVTYLDVIYEALLDFKLYGPDDRLTRRRPYRLDVEFGLGGSVHSEMNDDYSENYSSSEEMSVSDTTLNSNVLAARLKLEGFVRTGFSAQPLMFFGEVEGSTFSITEGTDFSYRLDNETQTFSASVDDITTISLALGAVVTIDDDMKINFNYTATQNDNDSDESSLKAAIKWRF